METPFSGYNRKNMGSVNQDMAEKNNAFLILSNYQKPS